MTNPTFDPKSLPPNIQVLQLITGKWVSQALYAVATLGVADRLKEGARDCKTLAAALQCDASSLYRVLRALSSIGIFVEDGQSRFGLTPLGETLRSDVPDSTRAFARWMGTPAGWSTWGDVVESVRTGGSAFERVHGEHGFEYLSKHPDEAAIFDEAMTNFSATLIPTLIASYDFSHFAKIVDVAGGRGHVLAGILKAHAGPRGILFDLPHVVEGTKRFLEQAGVASRCEVVAGDFFQSVPDGCDAYLVKNVIHDWDDARCETLLKNCRRAIAKTGKLLVLEMVIPPGNAPFFGKLIDLEMLVMASGGRERTEAEYRALFERTGFKLSRIVPTMSPVSVVEGIPA